MNSSSIHNLRDSVLSIVLVLVVASASWSETNEKSASPAAEKSFTVTLKPGPQVLSLGVARPSETLECQIVLQNATDGPLYVEEAQVSCGCLKVTGGRPKAAQS